jgi:hypothetical protein
MRGGAARSVADLFCRRLGGAAAAAGADRVCARQGWGRDRSGGRTVARRYAHYSELAALPAAVEWPNLKSL